MIPFVLDCSVTMSWCFEEEDGEYAVAVLEALGRRPAAVPSIWPFEVANVLLVAERRRKLTRADTARFVELLASLPIDVDDAGPGRALGSVVELGRASGLSAYDSAYLDLAMRLGAPLATLDRNLRAAAKSAGVELFVAGKGT